MRTNTDGLRSRLARLGKLAGTGACPRCRIVVRHTWLGDAGSRPRAEDPSLMVTTRCEVCGAPGRCDLSGYPEELREMARLYHASSLEDAFTDPRAWAAQRWKAHWDEARGRRLAELREARRQSAPERPANRTHDDARRRRERERAREKDPDVKLYEGLLAEAWALIARRRRRLERRYGKNPFPEIEALVAEFGGSDDDGTPAERLERARQRLLGLGPPIRRGPWFVCAEMEKMVLGGVSAYTAGKVEECERREQARIAQIKAQHEQLLEMLRRRDEECERQRGERQAAAPQPDPPPPPAAPDSPPAPAGPRPHRTGKSAITSGGIFAPHRRPVPPPQNEAPAPPAPAPAASALPRRPPTRRPKTLQDCWRLMEESARRRRS